MILVWTAAHGMPPIVSDCFRAIDAVVPSPFVHWIGDDFSPEADHQAFLETEGMIWRDMEIVGERLVYRCRTIGATGSPSMGLSFRWMFDMARATPELEALLVVESDVILRPGIVEAFREAQSLFGETCGAVAPLYVDVGGSKVLSVGGMEDRKSVV